MADLVCCDLTGLGRRAALAIEVIASVALGFASWLLLMLILGFAAMGLHAALFGAWPWPAKALYWMVGTVLGLI